MCDVTDGSDSIRMYLQQVCNTRECCCCWCSTGRSPGHHPVWSHCHYTWLLDALLVFPHAINYYRIRFVYSGIMGPLFRHPLFWELYARIIASSLILLVHCPLWFHLQQSKQQSIVHFNYHDKLVKIATTRQLSNSFSFRKSLWTIISWKLSNALISPMWGTQMQACSQKPKGMPLPVVAHFQGNVGLPSENTQAILQRERYMYARMYLYITTWLATFDPLQNWSTDICTYMLRPNLQPLILCM